MHEKAAASSSPTLKCQDFASRDMVSLAICFTWRASIGAASSSVMSSREEEPRLGRPGGPSSGLFGWRQFRKFMSSAGDSPVPN